MTRDELIQRAKAILAEAYEAAAEMIVLYLEQHPNEQIKPLCREIDPDNWSALEARVRRAKVRKASGDAPSSATTRLGRPSEAKSYIRNATPDQIKELVQDLPPTQRAAIVRAAVPSPERVGASRSAGPSFIDLLVKVSGALIELEAMVAGWQNRAAVPPEFSRESFNDVVAKVLRIQDAFDALDADDDDEFQKIVRNFRVLTSDVR